MITGGVQLVIRDLVDLALKCSMIPENLLAVHHVDLAVHVANILSSGTMFSWNITEHASGVVMSLLEQKNVDTGMGVEHTAAMLEGKETFFGLPPFDQ